MFKLHISYFKLFVAFRAVTGHHCEISGSVIPSLSHPPPHQVFVHIDGIPQTAFFSRLNSYSPLSLCLYVTCSAPLVTFVALPCTPSSLSLFHLYWGAQHWTQFSRCVSPWLSRGEKSSSLICWRFSAQSSPGGWGWSFPQGLIARSWSTWCSPGPPGRVLPSCFPAGSAPAWLADWGYSSPRAGLKYLLIIFCEVDLMLF